jgi:hypothetical protein
LKTAGCPRETDWEKRAKELCGKLGDGMEKAA